MSSATGARPPSAPVVGCVIPAAGQGERLGGSVPKALRSLSGVTLLEHSIRAIGGCRSVTHIVVATPAEARQEVASIVNSISVSADLSVVDGGGTRAESVRRAVAQLPEATSIILVHDAARPLVPVELVEAVVATVSAGAAAVVPVVPVTDTIKRVDEAGRVIETVDRADLRGAQTPQGFAADVLRAGLAQGPGTATDDAGLVERLGTTVMVIPGDDEAMKVTRPIDLVLAEAILRRRAGRVH